MNGFKAGRMPDEKTREHRRRLITIGTAVQANEWAPAGIRGCLGIVTDKGDYGVTVAMLMPMSTHEPGFYLPTAQPHRTYAVLRWDHVDFVGETIYQPVEEESA